VETETRVLSGDEIYRILIAAMRGKAPLPPAGWSASKLDDEVFKAGEEYEADLILRQKGALRTALFYLVDFARRMPERVNLTESNGRVKKMCETLSLEIEKIALVPSEVIAKDGKLKLNLCAILAVETCLIYREETERYTAWQEEEKRLARSAQANGSLMSEDASNLDKPKTPLVKNVRQKANPSNKSEDSSAQLSLF
jgi:hypothetical protein